MPSSLSGSGDHASFLISGFEQCPCLKCHALEFSWPIVICMSYPLNAIECRAGEDMLSSQGAHQALPFSHPPIQFRGWKGS